MYYIKYISTYVLYQTYQIYIYISNIYLHMYYIKYINICIISTIYYQIYQHMYFIKYVIYLILQLMYPIKYDIQISLCISIIIYNTI